MGEFDEPNDDEPNGTKYCTISVIVLKQFRFCCWHSVVSFFFFFFLVCLFVLPYVRKELVVSAVLLTLSKMLATEMWIT